MDKLSEKALEILENKYFGEVIAGEEENIMASALNLLWKYETEFSCDSESMDEATKYWLAEHKKESQKFEPSWSMERREEQTHKVHMIARAVRACSWLAQEETEDNKNERVVRCKNCSNGYASGLCGYFLTETDEDDFCSNGKVKQLEKKGD